MFNTNNVIHGEREMTTQTIFNPEDKQPEQPESPKPDNTEIEVLNGESADKGLYGLRQRAKDSPDITQKENRGQGNIKVL